MNYLDRILEQDGRILHSLGILLARDAHQVANPQPIRPGHRCAWCEPQGAAAHYPKGELISHGICEGHAAVMRAELIALDLAEEYSQ